MNQQYKIMIANLKVQLERAKAAKMAEKSNLQAQLATTPKEKKAMFKQQMINRLALHDRQIESIKLQIANAKAMAARAM